MSKINDCGATGGYFQRIQYLNNEIRFDYMGNAEYEFGAIPKAQVALIESYLRGDLRCDTITIVEVCGGDLRHNSDLADLPQTQVSILWNKDAPQNFVNHYGKFPLYSYKSGLRVNDNLGVYDPVGWLTVNSKSPVLFFRTDFNLSLRDKLFYGWVEQYNDAKARGLPVEA